MFEGFREHRISTGDANIFALTGGDGPPLLLLHGYPQTHVMWHLVAPRLRDRFSLVIPDLRGYGDSSGPPPDPDHVNYSKRAMARDAVRLMASLNHQRFFVAGHDRGARVAYRLALDHPERVSRLAVLDILPTFEVWERMVGRAAIKSYHWLLLSQPSPLPERLIGCDPEFFLRSLLRRWAGRTDAFDAAAVAEYLRCFRNPSVVEAACEDYRAGATVDLEYDTSDRNAGCRISCPTLLLWAKRYLAAAPPPLEVWRRWAASVQEVTLDCGHFVAEEEPAATAAALMEFFSG
jgi:haloacetate dehalogenase